MKIIELFYSLKYLLEEVLRSFPRVSLLDPMLDHEQRHLLFAVFLADSLLDYDEFCRS